MMKKRELRGSLWTLGLICIGMSAFLLLLAPAPVGANGPATLLWLDPPTNNLIPNEVFTVTIKVADVTDLYGIQFSLAFDPAVMQVIDQSAAGGIQIIPGSCPLPDFPLANQADNTAGTVEYATITLNPNEPCNGSGTVAQVVFRALSNGQSTIEFTDSILSNSDGVAIEKTIQGGSAVIEGESIFIPVIMTGN